MSDDGLFTWLQGIRDNVKRDIYVSDNAKNFVIEMHERGLVYHWEDDANDCLRGLVDTQESDLLNEVVSMLFNKGKSEMMFQLAIQLHNEEN